MTLRPSCLTCHQRPPVCRGCCPRCIKRHQTAVTKGETTWAELEAKGLALPAKPARLIGMGFKPPGDAARGKDGKKSPVAEPGK